MPQPDGQLLGLRAQAGKGAVFAAFCLAAAASEGLGLLLIVPLLESLGATEAGGGPIAALAARLGLPLSLGPLLGLFALLVLLRAGIVLGRTLAAQAFETAVIDALRRRAWHALLHAEWRYLAGLRRSESASLLITNVDRIGFGLNQLFAGLSTLVLLAGLGLAALVLAPPAAIGAALGGGLVLLGYRGLRRHAAQLGERLGSAYEAVHGAFVEGLAALRSIKSQGEERHAEDSALAGIAALRQAQRRYLVSQGLGQMALQGGGAAALALLVWLAAGRWQLGAAEILPLVVLFGRALPLLGALQENWQQWSHARPALDATLALIAAAEAEREALSDPDSLPGFECELALEAVSVHFAGEDRPALADASLSIPVRGMVALVGASGAGKSTLADLAGGLLSPDTGTVKLDGVVLEGPLRQAWRRRVAYVQQDPVVLSGTVRENLLWGAPASDEVAVLQALKDAAADFALALPQGLETRIGDGGRILSGGERQRLMLARALLRRPALLILDEATSALDPANEAAVAAALTRLKERMAVLVIAHRGALSALAGRVVTLEAGRIVAMSQINNGS
jgi:ATP-binding cassette subfamily C protein